MYDLGYNSETAKPIPTSGSESYKCILEHQPRSSEPIEYCMFPSMLLTYQVYFEEDRDKIHFKRPTDKEHLRNGAAHNSSTYF